MPEWQRTKPLLTTYARGYGFGMDMNGFGGTPAPPATARVTYPFTTLDGGSTVTRQTTGGHTWDYTIDGVAHYGWVPDWVEDLRIVGGPALVADLARGAESYLDSWAATRAHTTPVNLAAGRAATASSTQWSLFGSFVPGKASHGSGTTRWASARSDSQWWRVDLGAARQVGRVAIDWETAYANAYRIQTSLDGSPWSTAASGTGGRGGTDVSVFVPRSARYVRVVMTARATAYGYSMYEVNVQAR